MHFGNIDALADDFKKRRGVFKMKKTVALILSALLLTTGVAFADEQQDSQQELEKKKIMEDKEQRQQKEAHQTNGQRNQEQEKRQVEHHERVVSSEHQETRHPYDRQWHPRERYLLAPNTPFSWRQKFEKSRHSQEWIRDQEWNQHFPGLRSYRWQGNGFYYQGEYIDNGVFFYNPQNQLVGVGFVQNNTFVIIKENGEVSDNDDHFFLSLDNNEINDKNDSSGITVNVNANKETNDEPKQEQKEKSPPNLSWIGKWRTSDGEMQLKQTGDKVECVINNHKLSGNIIDDKIFGKWSGIKFFNSTETEGEFQLIMSSDGTYIQIKWKDNVMMNWVTDSSANRQGE